jgi:hypothetical protein
MATIEIVSLRLEVDGDQLLSIFRELEDVKPTNRKWVAASKVLYLLLPDLVVPTDGSTQQVGPLRNFVAPQPGAVRLGLGRVVDFAILGWMHDQRVSRVGPRRRIWRHVDRRGDRYRLCRARELHHSCPARL